MKKLISKLKRTDARGLMKSPEVRAAWIGVIGVVLGLLLAEGLAALKQTSVESATRMSLGIEANREIQRRLDLAPIAIKECQGDLGVDARHDDAAAASLRKGEIGTISGVFEASGHVPNWRQLLQNMRDSGLIDDKQLKEATRSFGEIEKRVLVTHWQDEGGMNAVAERVLKEVASIKLTLNLTSGAS